MQRANRPSLAVATLVLSLAAVAASCGGSSSSYGGGGTTACTAATATATTSVSMRNVAFNPACILVAPGATVTWTNQDTMTHTVTADDGSYQSGNVVVGQAYTHQYVTAGTYPYHCSIHPGMVGTVIVQ
jgi:plastocyanin